MVFSKSLGYAIRGLLYIAVNKNGKKIQLAEIAESLNAPRPFLAKVMKKLVKENIINSMKGPYGGFYLNEKTIKTTLAHLMEITGEDEKLESCILKLKKCTSRNPCPMHNQVLLLRNQWKMLLQSTTISDLLSGKDEAFVKSIACS